MKNMVMVRMYVHWWSNIAHKIRFWFIESIATILRKSQHFNDHEKPCETWTGSWRRLQPSLVANNNSFKCECSRYFDSETVRQLVLISYKWNCVSWGQLRNCKGMERFIVSTICRSGIPKKHSVSYRSTESSILADHLVDFMVNFKAYRSSSRSRSRLHGHSRRLCALTEL